MSLFVRLAELEKRVSEAEALKTALAINVGVLNEALDRLNKLEARECSCTKKKART